MMSHRLTAPRLVSIFAIAALTAAAACSQQTPEQPTAPAEPQPAPASTAPSVGYACESGATLQVQYADSDSAQLTYQNQTYALRSVQSASGARYIGAGMEWWTASRDGQESGTLSRLGPDGTTGVAVLERCSAADPRGRYDAGTDAHASPDADPSGRRRPARRDALPRGRS